MSNAPGVGTSVNVKSQPEVWGRPGVGLEIDRCIKMMLIFEKLYVLILYAGCYL